MLLQPVFFFKGVCRSVSLRVCSSLVLIKIRVATFAICVVFFQQNDQRSTNKTS